MSTRATYEIVLPRGGKATFYIHHDGFAQDAARYLLAAHMSRAHGSFADQFLRANERAELIESHEAIDDTQFRYTLTHGMLLAEKRVVGYDARAAWVGFFTGHYCWFINQYVPGTDLRLVPVSRYGPLEWTTRAQLDERIAALETSCTRLAGRLDNDTSYKAEIDHLMRARASFDMEIAD